MRGVGIAYSSSAMPATTIDDHCSSTEWARTMRSRSVARLVADVVGEQRLGIEAERPEHRDRRLLVGDDLDDHLAQVELDRLEDGAPCERPADAAAAAVGIDDHPHLADVARPAVQRHDGDVADDVAVLHRDGARRARARPRGDHLGRLDVLLEERPITLRDPRHESLDRLAVRALDRS